MPRARWLVLGLLVLVAGGVVAALAIAANRSADTIPAGATVAGVPVGGLTTAAAMERLSRRIGDPVAKPVRVRLAGRTHTLKAATAGVTVDLQGAVDRALAAGRQGSFLERGWRELTGGEVKTAETAPVTVDRAAVRRFVARLERDVARPAVDAKYALAVDHVSVTPSKEGRRLTGKDALTRRIVRALRTPGSDRRLDARMTAVAPAVTEAKLWADHPTAVTVSHAGRLVRVFERDKLVRTYHVAVGDPKYPTPYGTFSVQTMQKNPPWNVPQSEWAGDMAGKTVPGGDPANPLVARWIGFDGSVGFHGTRDAASIGQAASHGCVRMNPPDVIDLYERVKIGTPVLVA